MYFDYSNIHKQKGNHRKAKTQYRNALKCYMKLGNKEKIKEIMDYLVRLEKKV
jgi:hypothetical protein